MAKHPSVFLDRDSPLIENAIDIKQSSEVGFYPLIIEGLSLLLGHSLLFEINNRSGFTRLIREKEDDVINKSILNTFTGERIIVCDVWTCKNENNWDFSKPDAFFIEMASSSYNIQLSRLFVLGENSGNVLYGINAGIASIYLLTG